MHLPDSIIDLVITTHLGYFWRELDTRSLQVLSAKSYTFNLPRQRWSTAHSSSCWCISLSPHRHHSTHACCISCLFKDYSLL